MRKKVLIGVAWPYVNGDLHIGHLAGYLLPADIFARYNRLIGNEVLMVSGSDCFGTPITVEADKKGVSPTDIVHEYHTKDVDLFLNTLNLSYDLYTLTNHPNHIKVTQDFFLKFLEQDLLIIDATLQFYSHKESRFLPDRYVIGECPKCGYKDSRSDQCDNCGILHEQGTLKNPVSNISKEPVELKETQHYFIDWAKLQKRLEKYVEEKSPLWKTWVAQETKGWLSDGLKPRPITRDLDWGVPIPVEKMPNNKVVKGHEHKRIYVWFDAVIGYLSASMLWEQEKGSGQKYGWKDFWYGEDTAHYYFMGKDNLVFHTLFWPGQLMVYDEKIHLPDVASINMFLNYEGKQFSKSRGWSLPIKKMIEDYGNDSIRFYLTLIMPEFRDSSFAWTDFVEKVNGILVANLGNFIHRVLSIAKSSGTLEWGLSSDAQLTEAIGHAATEIKTNLAACKFREAQESLFKLSAFGNNLVDTEKVWELKNTDPEKFKVVVSKLLTIIVALQDLMKPFMPHAAARLGEYIGVAVPTSLWETGKLTEVRKVTLSQEIKPLFIKLDSNQIENIKKPL